jgi:hypothetical protein
MATKKEIIEALELSFGDEDQIVWQAVGYDNQFERMFDIDLAKWNRFVESTDNGSIADDLTDAILEFASDYEDTND